MTRRVAPLVRRQNLFKKYLFYDKRLAKKTWINYKKSKASEKIVG
jgi:hypothetical protein